MSLLTPEGSGAPTSDVIISTSLQLFAKYGYAATSMRNIADAVGIRAASLYNHFGSKEDILWDITEHSQRLLVERSRVAVEKAPDPVSALKAFVRWHVEFHAEYPHQAAVINSQFRSLSQDRHRRVVETRDEYERQLRGVLLQGRQGGQFDIIDPRTSSFAILQMGTGVSLWFRPDGDLSVEQVCDRYVEMALRVVGFDGNGK